MNLNLIQEKIFEIRGKKIMLDFDLANLYEVETIVFHQAVKRNMDNFPGDFMFQVTNDEWDTLRSQFVTLKYGRVQHKKYLPYAFTEHGVAMLASVLKSPKARKMNIEIVRAFIAFRKWMVFHRELMSQVAELQQRLGEHDVQLNQIYDANENLLDSKADEKKWKERERIGVKNSETSGVCR